MKKIPEKFWEKNIFLGKKEKNFFEKVLNFSILGIFKKIFKDNFGNLFFGKEKNKKVLGKYCN